MTDGLSTQQLSYDRIKSLEDRLRTLERRTELIKVASLVAAVLAPVVAFLGFRLKLDLGHALDQASIAESRASDALNVGRSAGQEAEDADRLVRELDDELRQASLGITRAMALAEQASDSSAKALERAVESLAASASAREDSGKALSSAEVAEGLARESRQTAEYASGVADEAKHASEQAKEELSSAAAREGKKIRDLAVKEMGAIPGVAERELARIREAGSQLTSTLRNEHTTLEKQLLLSADALVGKIESAARTAVDDQVASALGPLRVVAAGVAKTGVREEVHSITVDPVRCRVALGTLSPHIDIAFDDPLPLDSYWVAAWSGSGTPTVSDRSESGFRLNLEEDTSKREVYFLVIHETQASVAPDGRTRDQD